MTDRVVELSKVGKIFGDRQVLSDVTMHVDRGEVVGFVGPNGAGKTTSLRILVGLSFRDCGSVQVLGMDPEPDALSIRRRCCYLPGETSLYHNLTGREVLDFSLGFYGSIDTAFERRIREAFGLPLEQKVRKYSAGMKQQLALMATLIPDVELYILDEPDRNLDPAARWVLRDLIADLQQRQKSVIFSSHHLAELDAVAKRLVFLLDGEIVDPAEIDAARRALRTELRLRLTGGTELPGGTDSVHREPDGTLRVRTKGEPLTWLSQIDSAHVVSVEVGATRLDRIYQVLTRAREDTR